MKITVLIDNNTYIDEYYFGEPGVSYYIEADGVNLLFDTGYSGVFLENAKKLGIDISRTTHIVLSHGHNDHTGGLRALFDRFDMSRVVLLAHPDAFLPKYNKGLYVGSPLSAEEVSARTRYIPCTQPYHVTDDLICLGRIPRTAGFEIISPVGFCEKNGRREPDQVIDDTALAYKTAEGIFVITGCSHSGICNIIEYAKEITGETRIRGVLGGFHLLDDDDRLHATIRYLRSCGVKEFYPCHCVSLAAKAEMMKELPVAEVGVGLTISV